MKNILICSDGSAYAESLYRYGAWFAKGYGAKLTVLYVTDIRSQQVTSTGNLSGSLGLGASEALMQELVRLEYEKAKLNNARARLILSQATDQLRAAGVTEFQVLNKTGYLLDCLDTLPTDLIILGKRGENAKFASEHLGANTDRIVRSVKASCLVVPLTERPLKTLLVAYDGSPSGKRLLDVVRSLPERPTLHVLTVTRPGQTGDAHLQEAQTVLGPSASPTHFHQAAGEPDRVISDYIARYDVDLLAIGVYGQRRIRHLVIGTTTMQLLRSSTIPMLLVR